MGLADVLLGRKKLKSPAQDRLFALSTARVTLDAELGLKTAGAGGIVFKPLSAGEFVRAENDLQQVLDAVAGESGSRLERKSDDFGYEWIVVRDAAEELELKAKLEQELPIEPDLSRWFGLFNAPL